MRAKNLKIDERKEILRFVLTVLQGNKTTAIDLVNNSKPKKGLFIEGLTDADLIRLAELKQGEILQGFTPIKGFEHIKRIIVEN